jgi:hypothetical protein
MQRLREEFDSDLITGNTATEYRTETNRYEMPCCVCGKILYIDEEAKADLERALEHDLDNTLTCLECEQDAERLAYE